MGIQRLNMAGQAVPWGPSSGASPRSRELICPATRLVKLGPKSHEGTWLRNMSIILSTTGNLSMFIHFPMAFPMAFFFHMFPSFSETPSLPPRLSASAGTSCTSCASGTSGRVCQCDPSCCSQSRSSCGTTRRRSREIFSSPENIHLTCSEHLYIPPKVLKMPGKKTYWGWRTSPLLD